MNQWKFHNALAFFDYCLNLQKAHKIQVALLSGYELSASMNWIQFKDPLCYLCLTGTVVASWSLPQVVADSNNLF